MASVRFLRAASLCAKHHFNYLNISRTGNWLKGSVIISNSIANFFDYAMIICFHVFIMIFHTWTLYFGSIFIFQIECVCSRIIAISRSDNNTMLMLLAFSFFYFSTFSIAFPKIFSKIENH